MSHEPLSEWIAREGLTRADAARRLEVSKATLSKWATGFQAIPAEKTPRVEAVTGIPREQLRPDVFGPVTETAQ
jgi:DNA-binding transcriptional regulator YdaS (Cro superfamily)